MQVTVKVANQLKLQLHFGLHKLQVNYSNRDSIWKSNNYILGYRSYRLITVTMTVLEKVTVMVKITNQLQLQLHFGLQKLQVNYSYRDSTWKSYCDYSYKVAYASFQAGRRPARNLVMIKEKHILKICNMLYRSSSYSSFSITSVN